MIHILALGTDHPDEFPPLESWVYDIQKQNNDDRPCDVREHPFPMYYGVLGDYFADYVEPLVDFLKSLAWSKPMTLLIRNTETQRTFEVHVFGIHKFPPYEMLTPRSDDEYRTILQNMRAQRIVSDEPDSGGDSGGNS